MKGTVVYVVSLMKGKLLPLENALGFGMMGI